MIEKKPLKPRNRSSKYQTTLSCPEEILKEILMVDEMQIFIKEYEKIKESQIVCDSPDLIRISIIEYLKYKHQEISEQVNCAKSILEEKNSSNTIKQYLEKNMRLQSSIDRLEQTLRIIVDEIKQLIEEKDDPDYFNHNLILENFMQPEYITIRLNLCYHHGSDIQSQNLDIKINTSSTFEDFINEIKRTLGIYEFADFKLVLIENKRETKFVSSLADINMLEDNCIKIVPKTYTI
jgi:hypothetical protein